MFTYLFYWILLLFFEHNGDPTYTELNHNVVSKVILNKKNEIVNV